MLSKRVEILFDPAEMEALRLQAKKSKKSLGALIHDAVKEKYLTPTPKARAAALRRLLSPQREISFPQHSIHPLSDYDPANRQNYNCFEYALELHITCHYSVLVTLFELGVGVDYRFVNHLIQHEVLKQMVSSEAKLDDLLIYFHNGLPAHAGKWKSNKVISKWGKGLLYEHGIYEVPIKYGDPKYFRKVHPQMAKDYLIRYAKQNRVSDEDLEDV